MKNISGCLVFLIFFSINATSEELNKAHLFLEQKEYQKAQELYEQLQPKDGAVWFNLGQCYVVQEKTIDALICWKKAEKTAYGSHYLVIQDHIKQAEQKLGIARQENPAVRLYRLVKVYSLAVPVIVWQVIFLFLWYLVLCLLFVHRRLSSGKTALLVLCMVLTSGSLTWQYDAATARVAVVTQQDVAVYAGTDERFSQKTVIAQGQQVIIKQTDNAWHKVECNAGSGWVCADKLEEITT